MAVLWFVGPAAASPPQPPAELRLASFDPPPPAPAFSLPRLAGGESALADFSGHYVLLNFWATWCPPCVKEMPSMARLAQRFGPQRFTVLAVSLDTVDSATVAAFVRRLELPFPILLDPTSRVADVYGANALPASFLLDPQGRVIAAAKGERDWFSPQAQDYLERLLAGR